MLFICLLQELSNLAYQFSVLTFDDWSVKADNSVKLSRTSLAVHREILKAYRSLKGSKALQADFHLQKRFATYFETLATFSQGQAMVRQYLGAMPLYSRKTMFFDAEATKDSMLLRALQRRSIHYLIVPDFSEFDSGILPMSTAVFFHGKLVALVDSARDRLSADRAVRRINLLKEHIFAKSYPGVPVFLADGDRELEEVGVKIAKLCTHSWNRRQSTSSAAVSNTSSSAVSNTSSSHIHKQGSNSGSVASTDSRSQEGNSRRHDS